MPIDLGQRGLSQFTPEVQDKVFRGGIYGIDLSQGLPSRSPSFEQTEEYQRMQNIARMVDSGELVPRNNVEYRDVSSSTQQVIQQPVQPVQPVVQNAPVNNVQNEKTNNDFMEMLLNDDPYGFNSNAQSTPSNINIAGSNSIGQMNQQPQAPVQQQFQNEEPKIDWERVLDEQRNILRNYAATQGVSGDDVIKWMETLNPNDYVDMYNKRSQRFNINPKKFIPKEDNSLVSFAKRQTNRSYMPSIASMSGSSIASVPRDPQWNAFGLRKGDYYN